MVGEYSRYDLAEFVNGEVSTLPNLDYALWMVGYTFRDTFFDADGTDPLRENPANYGVKKVNFEVSDEHLLLLNPAGMTHSKSKDLILYDSLENYVTQGQSSDWYGTLQSVDLSQLRSLGIDPVVYYSTSDPVDHTTEDLAHPVSDTSCWHPLSGLSAEDYGTIKALAIDMRKDTNGDDFVLEAGASLSVRLYFRAPDHTTVEGRYAEAYNNVFIQCKIWNTNDFPPSDESAPDFVHQDFTMVRFLVTGDLNLHKVSAENAAISVPGVKFRLSGTSTYGTEVVFTNRYVRPGAIRYRLVELETKNGMTLFKDPIAVSPMPEQLRFDTEAARDEFLAAYEANAGALLDISDFTDQYETEELVEYVPAAPAEPDPGAESDPELVAQTVYLVKLSHVYYKAVNSSAYEIPETGVAGFPALPLATMLLLLTLALPLGVCRKKKAE